MLCCHIADGNFYVIVPYTEETLPEVNRMEVTPIPLGLGLGLGLGALLEVTPARSPGARRLNRVDWRQDAMIDRVLGVGGTVSGEHGVGIGKASHIVKARCVPSVRLLTVDPHVAGARHRLH